MPKRDTLPDLFRNIKKEQDKAARSTDKNSTDKKRPLQLQTDFITATQLEECKKIKLDTTTTINTTNDNDCKQIVDEKMEDKTKEEKLKMLFGDEIEDNGTRKKDDHKHSKRKSEKRKCESKTDEINDKKQCTNELNKTSESNDASSSVAVSVKKRPKLKKSEIGTLVVKLLTPAYAERRFDSRDTFKSTARTISHALLDKGELKLFSNVEFKFFIIVDESEIKKYVEDFLKNHLEITSRTTI